MKTLDHVPSGLDGINSCYGICRGDEGEMDQSWFAKYTAVYRLPFPMRTWNNKLITQFRAHILIGDVIEEGMQEIADTLGVEWMRAERWDFWGGCWWYRKQRGYDALSTHAWGIAFDVNCERCPLGGEPTDQHPTFAHVFKQRGFRWGGDWGKPWRCDPMHLQAASNY